MLRISPSMGHVLDMNMSLRHLLFLLEYCMVTGYDWWDILLHVQPSMVQNLVEKLHEEYMRQNAALQQVSGWELWARSQGGHRGSSGTWRGEQPVPVLRWLCLAVLSECPARAVMELGRASMSPVFTFTDISGSLPVGNSG